MVGEEGGEKRRGEERREVSAQGVATISEKKIAEVADRKWDNSATLTEEGYPTRLKTVGCCV
jgi:hypothetical protein